MTFTNGLLGALQALFLPGLAICCFLPLRDWLTRVTVILPLSLIFNYIIFFLLLPLSIPKREFFYLLIAAEVGVIVWFGRGLLTSTAYEVGPMVPANARRWHHVAQAAALAAGAWWAAWIYTNLGAVFSVPDVVSCYNRMAMEWAEGKWGVCYGYPPMMSLAYAVPYVLTGDRYMQLFAFPMTPITTFWMYFGFWAAYRATKRLGFLITAAVFPLLLRQFLYYHDYLFNGHPEVPTGSLAMLAALSLILGSVERERKTSVFWCYFGCLCATGAALLKQTGIVVALVFPLLAWWFVLRRDLHQHSMRKHLALVFAMLAGLGASYYLILALKYGIETKFNPKDMAILFNGYTIEMYPLPALQRFANGMNLIDHFSFHGVFWTRLIAAIAVLGLLSRGVRELVLLIGVPLFLLWAFRLSYDLRNAFPAFPFLALAVGFGVRNGAATLAVLRRNAQRGWQRLTQRRRLGMVLAVMFVLWVGGQCRFNDEMLRARVFNITAEISADSKTFKRVYELFKSDPTQKIYTTFIRLYFLPDKEFFARLTLDEGDAERRAQRLGASLANPEFKLFVVETIPAPPSAALILQALTAGDVEIASQTESWIIYRRPMSL